MSSITIPSKNVPDDLKNEVHKRVERLWLYGITRMLKEFAWHERFSKGLESLLEGRMAIYRQARDEYRKERGTGLERFLEEE